MEASRIELSEAQRAELEDGYRKEEQHCFGMRCIAVLLKSEGLSSAKVVESHVCTKGHVPLRLAAVWRGCLRPLAKDSPLVITRNDWPFYPAI